MEDRHVVLHDLKAYLPSNLQSKVGKGKMKTLPEAQRTQGIDSLTWVISPGEISSDLYRT